MADSGDRNNVADVTSSSPPREQIHKKSNSKGSATKNVVGPSRATRSASSSQTNRIVVIPPPPPPLPPPAAPPHATPAVAKPSIGHTTIGQLMIAEMESRIGADQLAHFRQTKATNADWSGSIEWSKLYELWASFVDEYEPRTAQKRHTKVDIVLPDAQSIIKKPKM